jgi:hypothetical protein
MAIAAGLPATAAAATPTRYSLVPGAPLTGVPLAGTSDPAVNAAPALLCHLQVSAPS